MLFFLSSNFLTGDPAQLAINKSTNSVSYCVQESKISHRREKSYLLLYSFTNGFHICWFSQCGVPSPGAFYCKKGCCRTWALLTKVNQRHQWVSSQCTQQPRCHFHGSVLQYYPCNLKSTIMTVTATFENHTLQISAKLFHELSAENHFNNFSESMKSAGTFIKMLRLCSISPAWKTSASITL